MVVAITTQAEMQRVRKAVSFCYLCGSSLREGKNAGARLNAEHLIPQALFGDAPARDAWRPILDVHARCHDRIKNEQGDETAILLHKLHSLQGDIKEAGWLPNLKRLGLVLREQYDPRLGQSLYMVKGFGDAHKAVWNWVRGLHAALYLQYLPSQMNHRTYAPMGELFIPEPDDTHHERVGPETFHSQKAPIARVLAHVASIRRFDGLRCWGGECQYTCSWAHQKGRDHMCMWGLSYKGAKDYAKGAPYSGAPGWLGTYQCVWPPPSRIVID